MEATDLMLTIDYDVALVVAALSPSEWQINKALMRKSKQVLKLMQQISDFRQDRSKSAVAARSSAVEAQNERK